LKSSLNYIENNIKEYPEYGSLYYLKANILSDLELFQESNVYFDLAIKNGFEEEITYYGRAYNYLGMGNCEKAIPFFEKHLETNVDDVQSWCEMGNCLNQLSRFVESIKCEEKALEMDPDYYLPYSYQGEAWMGLEEYEKAIICFEKALSLNPGDENSILNRDKILKKQ
jgi:tetratricopeptide (TPR) repeat protein